MRPLRSEEDVASLVDEEGKSWQPNPAGFPLVVTGLAAFVLGVAAFLWGQGAPGMAKYAWREVAGVAVAAALPFFMLGILVAFPTRRWSRVASACGAALTVAGVAVFVKLYPFEWNVYGKDGSPFGLVPYGVGILFMGAAAVMSLLDAYLDVRAGNPVGTRAKHAEDPVTAEEIARDLAEAATRSKLTWGGVQDVQGIKLHFVADSVGATVLHGSVGKRVILDDLDVGPEVTRLRAFQGTTVSAVEEEDENPAALLVAMRQRQEAEEAERANATLMSRIVTHMRAFFSPWDDPKGHYGPGPDPTRSHASVDDEMPLPFELLEADADESETDALLPRLEALAGARESGDDPPGPRR